MPQKCSNQRFVAEGIYVISWGNPNSRLGSAPREIWAIKDSIFIKEIWNFVYIFFLIVIA